MGFTINVWSLFAVSFYTHLPCGPSNRLVAAYTVDLEFIHTDISCAALQEKLHESPGWFIASSNGVSDTTNCYISVYPVIIK